MQRIEVFEKRRPKGRSPLWSCRVFEDDLILFSDDWVSVRFRTESSASWFADLFSRALGVGVVHLPKGFGVDHSFKLEWSGDLDDDCYASGAGYGAHVEHIGGPMGKGGVWHCEVDGLFHLADVPGLEVRSCAAGRWLCEFVLAAHQLGAYEPND